MIRLKDCPQKMQDAMLHFGGWTLRNWLYSEVDEVFEAVSHTEQVLELSDCLFLLTQRANELRVDLETVLHLNVREIELLYARRHEALAIAAAALSVQHST